MSRLEPDNLPRPVDGAASLLAPPADDWLVSPEDFEVRPAAPADYPRWLELWLGYNAFYGRSGATALGADITGSTWSRILSPAEPVNAVVLIQDQDPVAFAHYIFHPTTISVSPACYLQDLFVDPAFCRRGMGRALIESVTRHARSMGCHDVYWQTHRSNAPAIKLYESMATLSEFQLYRRLTCQPQSR